MDFQEALERRTKEYEKNRHLSEDLAKGYAFEDLTQHYIQTMWRSLGAKVCKWKDSELNSEMKGDSGCDLVVETRDKEFFLVQCKNHSESILTKDGDHLSNIFHIAAEKNIPKERIVFAYLAKGASHYASDTLETAGILIGEDDFEAIDWAPSFEKGKKTGKQLWPFQELAVKACKEGFKAEKEEGKRQVGKLIMACGTGKTFTSLSLVKELSQEGPYNVLFLAPSIALVSQTFQEWNNEEDIASVVVCSDVTASKSKKIDGDEEELDEKLQDVPFPVSTDSDTISQSWKTALASDYKLHVIFSTYQSIEAVKEFQEKTGVKFDLTICDEAHRTATEEGSLFSKAAEPDYIRTEKKLFMTATPKIYSDEVQDKAKDEYATVLYSMDDESKYGPEFFRFGFGEAVDKGVLCDYRVLILAMRKNTEALEDVEKLVSGTEEAKAQIEKLKSELVKAKDNLEKAKIQADMREFEEKLATLAGKIQGAYIDLSDLTASNQGEVYKAFDGLISYREVGKEGKLNNEDSVKRAAHSAIGFANSIRNSKIIAQTLSSDAFPGKDPKIKCCHIDGSTPSNKRLSDLDWLKKGKDSHEIRLITNAQCLSEGIDVPALDAVVFFERRQSQIGIIQAVGRVMRKPVGEEKKYGYIILPIMLSDNQTPGDMLENSDEFQTIWKFLQKMRSVDERLDAKINTLSLSMKEEAKQKIKEVEGDKDEAPEKPQQEQLPFDDFDKMQKEIVSFIVSKCGSSMYWDDWVENISGSVRNMIDEIDELADSPEIKPKFEEFKDNLSKTLHKDQTKGDAVNLIAQFIVTRPVFSILFPASDFDSNPISRALESIADDFKDAYSAYDKELGELKFSMEQAAKAVAQDPAARKRLVKNFYEKFYRKVFSKEAKTNGIVYTPEPVVDFMIKETDRLLERNFGKRLQDEGIQILDPFSGTGTFVTRLLDKDLGVIDDEHVKEKYEKEIWFNEIMPTAYYISTLNVEDAIKQRTGEAIFFPGAVLTDTFKMDEGKKYGHIPLFSANNDREDKENSKNISAIISNPPYYRKVKDQYGYLLNPYLTPDCSKNNGFYNLSTVAYIWASDRIHRGIICFITPNTLLNDYAFESFREKFEREFSDIYVLNLRGDKNQDRSQEFRDKEGDPIFPPEGGLSGKAIIFLVKNPDCNHKGEIHYIATGDYATREEKFEFLIAAKQTEPEWNEWSSSYGDPWNDKGNESVYLPLARLEKDKIDAKFTIFNASGRGIQPADEVVTFALNKNSLIKVVNSFIAAFKSRGGDGKEDIFLPNGHKCSKTLIGLASSISLDYANSSNIGLSSFKPFVKKYYYKPFIWRAKPQAPFFPTDKDKNLEICIGTPKSGQINCLMTKLIPERQFLGSEIMGLPLYTYETVFGNTKRKCAISDPALEIFREAYRDCNVLAVKDEEAERQIFYYVYGLFNSKEYKKLLRTSLEGSSFRIPLSSHFREFEKAGEELAAFHVGYETAPKSEEIIQVGEPVGEIGKMRLNKDKGVLTVNRYLSFENIPQKAFGYTINGKSPLEWLVNQYKGTPDIDYVVDLIPRLVTVSVKTQEIINSLPTSIDRITSMDSEIEEIWGIKHTAEGTIKS